MHMVTGSLASKPVHFVYNKFRRCARRHVIRSATKQTKSRRRIDHEKERPSTMACSSYNQPTAMKLGTEILYLMLNTTM